jgi:hypothetical protein
VLSFLPVATGRSVRSCAPRVCVSANRCLADIPERIQYPYHVCGERPGPRVRPGCGPRRAGGPQERGRWEASTVKKMTTACGNDDREAGGPRREDHTAPSHPMASVGGCLRPQRDGARTSALEVHRRGRRTTPQSGLAQCSRVVRSARRTRRREAPTVTEDAVRATPARRLPPGVFGGLAARRRVVPQQQPSAARAPASPGPRSPHPRLARRRGPHACRQRPTRPATPWAGTCCPAGYGHTPTEARTACSPRGARIRAGT